MYLVCYVLSLLCLKKCYRIMFLHINFVILNYNIINFVTEPMTTCTTRIDAGCLIEVGLYKERTSVRRSKVCAGRYRQRALLYWYFSFNMNCALLLDSFTICSWSPLHSFAVLGVPCILYIKVQLHEILWSKLSLPNKPTLSLGT
jgi:hypothetical protein